MSLLLPSVAVPRKMYKRKIIQAGQKMPSTFYRRCTMSCACERFTKICPRRTILSLSGHLRPVRSVKPRGRRILKTFATSGGDGKVEVHRESLDTIFDGKEYLFSTKNNMREYCWTQECTENLVGELIQDLIMNWQRGIKNFKDMDVMELGQIVVVRVEAEDYRIALLQDGQQRMITICLLLATLRDVLRDESQGQDIDQYLQQRIKRSGELVPRVAMRNSHGKLLARILEPGASLASIVSEASGKKDGRLPGDSDVDVLLRKNAKAVQAMVAAEASSAVNLGLVETKVDFARELLGFTLDCCNVMVYDTRDKRQAHKHIRSLGKGLDQSFSDMFKAEVLIEHVESEASSDSLINEWRTLEQEVSLTSFQLALLALASLHLLKPYKTDSEPDYLLEWFLSYAKNHSKGDSVGETFFKYELQPGIRLATTLLNGQLPQRLGASNESASCIRSLCMTTKLVKTGSILTIEWLPVAIQLARQAESSNDEGMQRGLFLLERLQMFFILTGVNTRMRKKRCLEAMKDPTAMDLSNEEQAAFLNRIKEPFRKPKEQAVAKALLFRLNEAANLDAGEPLQLDLNNPTFTLEHCLPKQPSSGSQWEQDFDKEEHAFWVDRIGNLLLLSGSRNSKIKNKDFSDKAEHFRDVGQSSFPLTTQAFSDETYWTKEVLEEREQAILRKAKDIWFPMWQE